MIENIPNSAQFDHSAKASFFAGWNELMHLLADFEISFPPDEDGVDSWKDEREDYYQSCQAEFQNIISFTAQANELALKSRVCEVSPYLLILGNEPKFKITQEDLDFTDFRTIDAVDLPAVVNTVSNNRLPIEFHQRYSKIRKLRNRIIHQGAAGIGFKPNELILLLTAQYADLWPQKRFLNDWFEYISSTRFSFFHDGKWSSAGMELVEMLDVFFSALTSSQIESLTGYPKNKRRYVCLRCFSDEAIENAGGHPSSFRTAYLLNQTTLHCHLCDEQFAVNRLDCPEDDCKGNVLGTTEQHQGVCHTCGLP
ncbi:hypothetical protein [Loktanella sp. 5RATIMAR09]|uniref:hypothetical protein n=1 Tax=Loktanella sp. 5RATIMAR09 TaxID=1225655 RepID=UPI0012EE6C06|nr:hypothetical protein [Loktanella sp. 5RATIMAR09]